MDSEKTEAIILANALIYASPSYDKNAVSKKQQNWDRFINALDWRYKLKDTKKVGKKRTVGQLFGSIFGGKVQVPIVTKSKGAPKKE
jgi:hypothetical protein